ncbi:dynamin family protein [Ottowia thiooxydans]|uniref:dynamin family protein n=1 Tax=Ottowia thiooxydans TaxID=219182 RepID=UPI00040D4726|nr:dynamin family protein [Ottowia thiooxydans]
MTGFHAQFDRYGAWRKEAGLRLKNLTDWLEEVELLDAGSQERVKGLAEQLRTDKVMVAFVAEFSRGKSELINAVFFPGYGRRIMPARAGRTTMCPTELGYDSLLPPCLRLLPIETRLQPQSLLDWRMLPERWTHLDLDMSNPAQLAGAMEKVSETRSVSKEMASALGFWHDDRTEDNPPISPDGMVSIPRWRHALVNMAHPLLKQGLVVLDTPGLNAIGAEPELTVNLIPQAQAVVFILAADTGVTKSDLAIWREHLAPADDGPGMRFALLNKIDTLWDGLNSPRVIEEQIEQQRLQAAQILSLEPSRVQALSAQKGLLAKVRGDEALLEQSRLPAFEQVLGRDMLGARQRLLEGAILQGVNELQAQAQRTLGVRRRELFEQMQELRGLRGKNRTVIRQMRLRVEQEKAEFDRGASNVVAVRSVHTKLLRDVFKLLGNTSTKKQLVPLTSMLREPGMKMGIKRAYAEGFGNLHDVIRQARSLEAEIESMLAVAFRQLNADYGFALQLQPVPELGRFETDLKVVERSHLQYLGIGNMLQLSRPEFAERLARALFARVRSIFDAVLGEIELWNKSASAQLDVQLRERQQGFARRIEAIERIQEAAGGLDQRLGEIEQQEVTLNSLDSRLAQLTRELRQARLVPLSSAAPEVVPA